MSSGASIPKHGSLEEDEECPICGYRFPQELLEAHVDICLEQIDADEFIISQSPQQQSQPQAQVVAMMPHELPLLDGFRNESFGVGQSFNIARMKRDGGVLYVNVEDIRRKWADAAERSRARTISWPKLSNLKRNRKKVVFATIEFEQGLTNSKTVFWDLRKQPCALKCGLKLEFALLANDYYGPLPIYLRIYSENKISILGKSEPKLLAEYHLRLSDGFGSSLKHLEELGNVLSIADPYEMVNAIRRFKMKSTMAIDVQTGDVSGSADQQVEGAVLFGTTEFQSQRSSDYSSSDSNRPNIHESVENDNFIEFLKGSCTKTFHPVISNLDNHSYSELLSDIQIIYFSFTNLFIKSEPQIRNWIHPLHFAIFYGSEVLLNSLFEHSGRRKQPGICGNRTCTHIAALMGQDAILKKLLEGSPEDAYKPDSFGRTPTHFAVFGAELEQSCDKIVIVLDILREFGANLDSVDSEGTSPLLLASELGCSKAVKFLLENKAKPTLRNCDGDSALSLATQYRKHETMQVLLETSECKELLDMYNNSGKHCLSIATDLGDIESVQLLLSKGARQWSSPVDGQIPLHIAASQGHVEIVRMLLRAIVSRAKLDKILQLRDKCGENVFVKARKGHHEDVYEILEDAKKDITASQIDNALSDPKNAFLNWRWADVEEDTTYFFIESLEEANMRRITPPLALSPKERSPFVRSDPNFGILEESSAVAEHQTEVREIASVLEGLSGTHVRVPLSTAGVLLRNYRWNTEKLLQDFSSDPEKVCAAAGISLLNESYSLSRIPENYIGDQLFCGICLTDYPVPETNQNFSSGFALDCNHWFCKDCWKGFLIAKLSLGPGAIYSTCPALNCKSVCHEDLWHEVLSDDHEYLSRYSTFLVRSYIDLNPSLRWCGSPTCSKAVYYTGTMKDVTCVCGFKMCFKCGLNSHSPASCLEIKKWMLECEGDGKDLSFILKTSKQCPRCGVAIHRVSGCNHIRCKICMHEFCWLCLGPWKQHGDATGGFYQCNLYDPNSQLKQVFENKNAGSFTKFVHYLTRYQNHQEDEDFAQARKKQLLEQKEETKDDFAEMKLKLLVTALIEIIESRRVLKFTYVSAYYMEDDARKKNLFEHLQEMLEKNTEYLQELIEEPEEGSEFYVDFEQIRNFTQLIKSFSKRVIDFAQDTE